MDNFGHDYTNDIIAFHPEIQGYFVRFVIKLNGALLYQFNRFLANVGVAFQCS